MTGGLLEPEHVVCDIEAPLLDAVLTRFRNARVCGCFFHWKQDLLRRTKKLRIPSGEIKVAIEAGSVDWLAAIQPDQVEDLGIQFFKHRPHERIRSNLLPFSATKWEAFWKYFDRQWLHRVRPDLWSKYGIDADEITPTNNPREHFNRKLNNRFHSLHPSLANFAGVVESISHERVRVLHDIQSNRAEASVRATL